MARTKLGHGCSGSGIKFAKGDYAVRIFVGGRHIATVSDPKVGCTLGEAREVAREWAEVWKPILYKTAEQERKHRENLRKRRQKDGKK